jgi:hypothetical protein
MRLWFADQASRAVGDDANSDRPRQRAGPEHVSMTEALYMITSDHLDRLDHL